MHGIIRLSVSEAAKMFGVNPRTIRRAISAGEVSYVVVQGRYKIGFEGLIKWSQKKSTIKNKTEKYGLGQFVEKWKIKNKRFSPNPQVLAADDQNKNGVLPQRGALRPEREVKPRFLSSPKTSALSNDRAESLTKKPVHFISAIA